MSDTQPAKADNLDRPDPHPVNQLDDVVHQQFRFGIMALLSSVEAADFTTLRDTLDVTDGNLNRHLAVLADHDFVAISKARHRGRRTRTWVQLTNTGRAALDKHVAALRAVLNDID